MLHRHYFVKVVFPLLNSLMWEKKLLLWKEPT